MPQTKKRTTPPRYAPPGQVVVQRHPANPPTAAQIITGAEPATATLYVPDGNGGMRPSNPSMFQGIVAPTARPEPPELCEGGMQHAWQQDFIDGDRYLHEHCSFCPAQRVRPAPEGMTLGPATGAWDSGRPAQFAPPQAIAPKRVAVLVRIASGDDTQSYTIDAQVPGDLPPQAALQEQAQMLRKLADEIEGSNYKVNRGEFGIWNGAQ